MTIPAKFRLMGHEYEVVWNPRLYCLYECYGQTNSDTLTIELQPNTESVPLQKTVIEQAFMHELVHAVLRCMERDDLDKDEGFIEVFSGLVHQAMESMV